MEREGPFTSPIEEDVMGLKIASALLVAAGLLLVSAPASAQDLGPHFKKVKDGIITYVAKPDESNCTIVLSNEGVVLIDSGRRRPILSGLKTSRWGSLANRCRHG
jgi:hypothetical protein